MLQLYHIGGANRDESIVKSVYAYDEANQQWQSATPLPQELATHKCTVFNCQGLVCGGVTGNDVFSSVPSLP